MGFPNSFCEPFYSVRYVSVKPLLSIYMFLKLLRLPLLLLSLFCLFL